MKSFIEQSHPENHESEAPTGAEFNPQLRQQLHSVALKQELSVIPQCVE